MLKIDCPHCGPRDEPEFAYGGEAHLVRPALDVSDARWSEYLFLRDNKRGVALERWRHVYGCGLWFNLARDTASHAIRAVYGIAEQPPEGVK